MFTIFKCPSVTSMNATYLHTYLLTYFTPVNLTGRRRRRFEVQNVAFVQRLYTAFCAPHHECFIVKM